MMKFVQGLSKDQNVLKNNSYANLVEFYDDFKKNFSYGIYKP